MLSIERKLMPHRKKRRERKKVLKKPLSSLPVHFIRLLLGSSPIIFRKTIERREKEKLLRSL